MTAIKDEVFLITDKKELRQIIKSFRNDYSGHINLSHASVSEMHSWLKKAQQYMQKPKQIEETEIPVKIEIQSCEIELENIAKAKTLSNLGLAIASLSEKGKWHEWTLKYWSKNGECRIYLKDRSYTNPKDRGFLSISPDGTCQHFGNMQGSKFPGLPEIPLVTNDLVKTEISAEERAIRNLNRRYGVNGWDKFDLEDELEDEQYQ